MRQYELAIVFNTKLTEKDRTKILDNIKTWLKDIKVVKEDVWGQKPLSYPIKKQLAGYYVMLQLEGESLPSDVERRILQTNDVLRHLLIRTK